MGGSNTGGGAESAAGNVLPASWSPGVPLHPQPAASIPIAPPRPRVQIGKGLALGFAVALFGGLIWGLIAAASGYVFTLLAIGIGYGVSWAIAKGAGGVTTGLIVACFVLTLFSVFVGSLVTLSIILAPYGASPLDVLALYPTIVAQAPRDVLPGYFFGLIGAGFGAYALHQQRRMSTLPPPSAPYTGFAPGEVPGMATPAVTSAAPQVQIARRGTFDVTLEVAFPPRPNVVRAYYTTSTGRAEVHIDGRLMEKTRVWGRKKEVALHLPDTGQPVVVRFLGAMSPRIEMLLDGNLVAGA